MKRSVRWPRRWCLAPALAGMVLAGCGGRDPDLQPAVPASGTVTYKAKPVSKGAVHFQPEKGHPASGIIDEGRFTLTTYDPNDGAVAGKHKVGVEVTREVPTKGGDTTVKYLIPEKYARPDESGIEVEIPPGGNTDIQIGIK